MVGRRKPNLKPFNFVKMKALPLLLGLSVLSPLAIAALPAPAEAHGVLVRRGRPARTVTRCNEYGECKTTYKPRREAVYSYDHHHGGRTVTKCKYKRNKTVCTTRQRTHRHHHHSPVHYQPWFPLLMKTPPHYDFPIQPVDFILKNRLGFCEGNIIKYICRWQLKNGREDLLKARHYIDILITELDKDSAESYTN